MALPLTLTIPFYLGLLDFNDVRERFRSEFCTENLNISPDSSETEIRKAFRKLVKKLHTDKTGSTDTLPQLQRLNAAYTLYVRFLTAVTTGERSLVLGTVSNIARPFSITAFWPTAMNPSFLVEKLSAMPGTLMVLSVPSDFTQKFAPWMFVAWKVGRLSKMISSGYAFTLGVLWEIVKYGRNLPVAHPKKILEIGFWIVQNMLEWQMRLFASPRFFILDLIRKYYRVDKAKAMREFYSRNYRARIFGYGLGWEVYKDLLQREGTYLEVCKEGYRRGKEDHMKHMSSWHGTVEQLKLQVECLRCGEPYLIGGTHYEDLEFYAEHECMCPNPQKYYLPAYHARPGFVEEYPPIEYSRFNDLPAKVSDLARLENLRVSKPLLAGGDAVFRIYR